MPLIEQALSGQEIIVPPKLPSILKQFCKAAIRTQPYDLIKWSSAYFRALADGEEPPTKLRLEYPPSNVGSNLTLGFLRVLLRQFGGNSHKDFITQRLIRMFVENLQITIKLCQWKRFRIVGIVFVWTERI